MNKIHDISTQLNMLHYHCRDIVQMYVGIERVPIFGRINLYTINALASRTIKEVG